MTTERREFEARPEAVGQMLEFVDAMTVGLPTKASHDLRMACEEILVNIASYAYPAGDGQVTVLWDDDRAGTVQVRFEDAGTPFDPLDTPEPDLDVPIAERAIGGLGIMLVRRLMDDVQYSRAEGKNILTITKAY